MNATEAECTACPLFAGCQRQLLSGVGPKNAKVMLVGEAPGKTEDRVGQPFVGDAGALLNRLLERSGMRREDVFVTNAVRCRPPENRKPTAKEINACKVHLLREIDAIKPELVIALGNSPLKSLTGLSGIKAYRGAVHEMHKSFTGHRAPVVAAYHPAFALRYPEHEGDIVTDLTLAVRQMFGGFTDIETPWGFFRNGHVPQTGAGITLGFDIETNARDLHDPDLRVWFMGVDDGNFVHMFVGEDEVRAGVLLLQEHLAAGGTAVGHNASPFDRAVLAERFGVNLKCDDTQLLAHLIDETQALGLQPLCIKYLGVRPWKDDFDVEFWRRSPQSKEEWERAFEYTARDTRYDRVLFGVLWELATPAERRLYREHNLPCSRALRTTERHGVYLSVDNIKKAIEQVEVDQQIALFKLKEQTSPEFNPGSHQQVRELLFSDLMLPVQKKTRSQEASTDEEALKRLQTMGFGGDLLKTILEYRENSKMLGTYLRPFLRFAQNSLVPPYVFPSYSMTTTVTGRTSSFGTENEKGEKTAWNIQNTPRKPMVRSCVAAPPGWVMLEADYSQIELRLAGEFAGMQSPLFQEYLKPNPDVHLTMAQRLTRKLAQDVTEEERSRAKPANFASLYQLFTIAARLGIESWKTYQRIALTDYDMVVTKDECLAVQQAFSHWGLDPWYERRASEIYSTGQITTLFGRTRRLPGIRSRDNYAQLEALREGLNFDDQSTAGDLALLSHACLVGYGYWTCGYIHDANLVLIPDDPSVIAQASAHIKWVMEVETTQIIERVFGYRFSIPIIAEVKCGPHWGYKKPKAA